MNAVHRSPISVHVLLEVYLTCEAWSRCTSCLAEEGTLAGWAAACAAGAAAVQRYSGAAAGDRTMLDAILPAVEALRVQSGEHQ